MPNNDPPNIARHHKIATSLCAGAIAGACAKTAIAPLDRTKINFQVSNKVFTFAAAADFLRNVVRNEGAVALWRGNSATMARVIPFAAIQFTAHEQWKYVLHVDRVGSATAEHFNGVRRYCAGSLAGVTATSMTYPLDLARARLAVDPKTEYRSLSEVFMKIYSTEGALALYRGFVPTLLGVIPYAGTSFFIYESLKHWHRKRTRRRINAFERLLFGAMAGMCGQSASYPLDIARRRLQTTHILKGQRPPGFIFIIRSVIAHEGIRKGLFKGLSMNWIKGPIAVGISFTTYDTIVWTLRHLPYFHHDSSTD